MQIDKNTLQDLKSWMVSGLDAIVAYAEALENEYQRMQTDFEEMRRFNHEKVSQLAHAQEKIEQLEQIIAEMNRAAEESTKKDSAASAKEALPEKTTPPSAETSPPPEKETETKDNNVPPAPETNTAPASNSDTCESAVNQEESAPSVLSAIENCSENVDEEKNP